MNSFFDSKYRDLTLTSPAHDSRSAIIFVWYSWFECHFLCTKKMHLSGCTKVCTFFSVHVHFLVVLERIFCTCTCFFVHIALWTWSCTKWGIIVMYNLVYIFLCTCTKKHRKSCRFLYMYKKKCTYRHFDNCVQSLNRVHNFLYIHSIFFVHVQNKA